VKAGHVFTDTIHGRLPGVMTEWRYRRTSDRPGFYKHVWESPTDTYALDGGGLLTLPKPQGGPMATRLWLDNPRHRCSHCGGGHMTKHHDNWVARGGSHHHTSMHRGLFRGGSHYHNPYLAAYNPAPLALLRSYVSLPYLQATLSGAGGFGLTYLGYKVLFGFVTPLATYAADPGWTGILVRAGGRLVVAAVGDFALVRFFSGHNRIAYIGGAAAYIGLASLLEALGYQVTVGSGAPLVSVLPAALQPASSIAGVDAFIHTQRQRPRAIAGAAGAGAFVQVARRGLGLHPSRMYTNRLSPA